MATILIGGGSGLIGQRLQIYLTKQGHEVRILTRKPKHTSDFAWNPAANTLDHAALEGIDHVINLTGAGIADQRWTTARKKELIQSRVDSIHTLSTAFAQTGIRPKTFVSASAIGIYGDSGEHRMLETTSPADNSFMVQCCTQWESATQQISAQGIRTIILRIGVVLDLNGGALAEILKPLRLGIGTTFANGQAWWSWVHAHDICRMIAWSIQQPEVTGVYNAVAPNPVRNNTLIHTAAQVFKPWAIKIPVPAFALRLMLGEMSAVVLNSNLVDARKLTDQGFTFAFPTLEAALHDLKGGI